MRIEKINENKIKVLIGSSEAKELNITEKMIAYNTPEVQRMFRRAIAIAEESANFYIDGAKLFVETIPSYTDGIGMLITKVCSEQELEAAVNNCSYKGKIRRSEIPPVSGAVRRGRKYIYKFDDFDDVCRASVQLIGRFDGLSHLYKLDGEFYLFLMPSDPAFMCDVDTILSEFSQKVRHGQYVHGRLNEYGELMIRGNAVSILYAYFG